MGLEHKLVPNATHGDKQAEKDTLDILINYENGLLVCRCARIQWAPVQIQQV